MKIRIGIGTDGEILKDLEEAKACNFCTKFLGHGLHWISGYCKEKDKRLISLEYRSEAKFCDSFDCKPDLLRE